MTAKTELRLTDHASLPGCKVVEMWHGGKLIGTICGAEGAGVRVVSPHEVDARTEYGLPGVPVALAVRIAARWRTSWARRWAEPAQSATSAALFGE